MKYVHLLGIVVVYALLLFIFGRIIEPRQVIIAGVGMGLCVATIQLVGIWSVFGPGNYLMRLGITHAAGLLIALCFGLGWHFFKPAYDYTFIYRDFYRLVISFLLIVPPLSAAVQIPLWVCRVLFGWQLVPRGGEPVQAFRLREIFTFTFVIALALLTTQISARLAVESDRQTRQLTNPQYIVDERGNFNRLETEAQFEEANRIRDRIIRSDTLQMVRMASVVLLVVTMFAFPVLVFVFRTKEPSRGCLYGLLYCLVICIFRCLLFLLLFYWVKNAGRLLPDETTYLVNALPREAIRLLYDGSWEIDKLFLFLVCITVSISAEIVPLLITRSRGFELTSPRQRRRQKQV